MRRFVVALSAAGLLGGPIACDPQPQVPADVQRHVIGYINGLREAVFGKGA